MTSDDFSRPAEAHAAPAAEDVELTAPAPSAPLAPTAGNERVETIDVLRGLALFGILAANIRGFAGPAAAYFQPDVYWGGLADRIAQAFIDTFIQQKFITIFAFLFGVGFAAQLSRAESRGSRFGWMYARRLLVLTIFGLLHGLFIWMGDILLVYGLIGFALFFFRRRADRTLIAWAVIGMLIPLFLAGTVTAVVASGAPVPLPPPPTQEELRTTTAVFAEGTWSEIQQQRASDAVAQNWGMMPFFGSQVLGHFLLGYLAWRRRFFQPSPESLLHYRQVMIWALAIGLAGNITATALRWIFDLQIFALTPLMFVVMLIQSVAVPALSLGYVCAVILLCHSVAWRRRLARFGAVGRTALSNYLLQSVIGTLLFYSYGLGLFGTMGPALLLIPTLAIYALQVMISPWWLSRFRFGPAEWLWRSLTYGTLQPFVRESPAASAREANPAA